MLLFVESTAVIKRLQELYHKQLEIKGTENLFDIHKYLFQDIYVWAGKKRVVEISKDGKQFFPISRFDSALKSIDKLITEFKSIPNDDLKRTIREISRNLDYVNFLHPFREGNGRAQREFLRQLALEKELKLNLNPPDNKDVYERYMKGTIEGDVGVLEDLIFELINTAVK